MTQLRIGILGAVSYFLIAMTAAVSVSFADSHVRSQTAPLIIALGDSVTYGVRADHTVLPNQTFVSRLERLLSPDFPGLTIVNAGVPGNNTRDVLRRLDNDVLQKKPDLVILMIGINDSAYVGSGPHGAGPIALRQPRVPLDEFRRNILEIVNRIKSTGAAVLLVTPNPISRAYVYSNVGYYGDHDINQALRKYVAALVSISVRNHIPLVDVFQNWISVDDFNKYLVDGIHPNPEGHARIAALLAGECRVLLTEKLSQ